MNRRAKWRTLLLPLAVTGFLAGATTGALATGGGRPSLDDNRDTKVINGCYQKQNGQLRILLAGQQCGPSEMAISWNIQGPPGPPGMNNVERVEFSSAKNTEMRKNAFAKCPEGTHVVGGGAQVFISGQGMVVGPIALKKSFPSEHMDGWAATAEAMAQTEESWFVSAYALCAKMASSGSN
ncbi:MAG: hypothetical protein ACHQ9S_01505 [Candidatus Binatia bacterium]